MISREGPNVDGYTWVRLMRGQVTGTDLARAVAAALPGDEEPLAATVACVGMGARAVLALHPVWLVVTDTEVALLSGRRTGLHRPRQLRWIANRYEVNAFDWQEGGDPMARSPQASFNVERPGDHVALRIPAAYVTAGRETFALLAHPA